MSHIVSAARLERARLAAERLRREIAEHTDGPDCGEPDCILHRLRRSRA